MLQRPNKGKPLSQMYPVPYGEKPKGRAVPDRVIYLTGGSLAPHIPADPDMPPTTLLASPIHKGRNGRLPNGLSPRADCMARLMARGVSGVDALKAAYGHTGSPLRLARKAHKVTTANGFRDVLRGYRERLEGEGRQEAVGMRDFVLSRLTLEAQTAKQDAARIQALKLLGQSEAMWTTVQRTEKSIDPKDLQALKAQLEQRLRDALTRLNPSQREALSQGLGTGDGPDSGLPDRTGAYPPLNAMGPGQPAAILIPPHDSPEMHPGDLFGSPLGDEPGGSSHREMEAGDL